MKGKYYFNLWLHRIFFFMYFSFVTWVTLVYYKIYLSLNFFVFVWWIICYFYFDKTTNSKRYFLKASKNNDFAGIINPLTNLLTSLFLSLKSVNSNFTLAVHSPKLYQAKTHFLSHFGKKRAEIWLDWDLNPWSVDQKLIIPTITP